MTGLMPTCTGDVVVSHHGTKLLCAVWTVASDQQQVPDPAVHVSSAHGLDAALTLAKMMVRDSRRGDVCLCDMDSLTWMKASI